MCARVRCVGIVVGFSPVLVDSDGVGDLVRIGDSMITCFSGILGFWGILLLLVLRNFPARIPGILRDSWRIPRILRDSCQGFCYELTTCFSAEYQGFSRDSVGILRILGIPFKNLASESVAEPGSAMQRTRPQEAGSRSWIPTNGFFCGKLRSSNLQDWLNGFFCGKLRSSNLEDWFWGW